jgi:hypothetical protein
MDRISQIPEESTTNAEITRERNTNRNKDEYLVWTSITVH